MSRTRRAYRNGDVLTAKNRSYTWLTEFWLQKYLIIIRGGGLYVVECILVSFNCTVVNLVRFVQALMMDDKAAPIQHITYNSNKYEHFNNSEEDDDRKPPQYPPQNSLPPTRPE